MPIHPMNNSTSNKNVCCYIGLGSNLNNPRDQIQKAFTQLDKAPHIQLLKTSSLYLSHAIGPPQPQYINAAALLSTPLEPLCLLDELQRIEDAQGRIRGEHWGPRTLDLDLLLYGDEIIQTLRLRVPHPELKNRPFVIWPLYEIAPDLQLPDQTLLSSLRLQKFTPDEQVLLLS